MAKHLLLHSKVLLEKKTNLFDKCHLKDLQYKW
jgi:hypothetical protein